MEKVPQKRPVESSGTKWLILASVAVLLLVAVMLVNIFWQATHPKPLTNEESALPTGAARAMEAPLPSAPQSLPGR